MDQKEIVLMWVPGHVGIWENGAADGAVKEALDKTTYRQYHALFKPKHLTAKYISCLAERMG